MTEILVAKAGGTSNATSEAVEQCLYWAEQADIFVVSAPGKIAGSDAPKVTDLLIHSRHLYLAEGEVEKSVTDEITERFDAITRGLGGKAVNARWIDSIAPRVQRAASHSEDAASMLGERLQADIYRSLGFTVLDPYQSPHDLGNDPDAWRAWLSTMDTNKRYVLPGNTTKVGGRLATFDRGGSDISGGLAAYGIHADLNLNLTDGRAMSADPRLIPKERLRPISHLLYEEGRELGRNGTGLVHAAAMVPLMIGNIPTEIRSTFDPNQPPTMLDNDYERAAHRCGKVVALSLMPNVVIHSVKEPGMAEAVGRLAEFDRELAEQGIPIIDTKGKGVDGQKFFVEAKHADKARDILLTTARHGSISTKANIDLITLVGYRLSQRLIDNIFDLSFNAGINAKQWQREKQDLSDGDHSLRISVDSRDSAQVLDRMHRHYMEFPLVVAALTK